MISSAFSGLPAILSFIIFISFLRRVKLTSIRSYGRCFFCCFATGYQRCWVQCTFIYLLRRPKVGDRRVGPGHTPLAHHATDEHTTLSTDACPPPRMRPSQGLGLTAMTFDHRTLWRNKMYGAPSFLPSGLLHHKRNKKLCHGDAKRKRMLLGVTVACKNVCVCTTDVSEMWPLKKEKNLYKLRAFCSPFAFLFFFHLPVL